MLFLIFNTAKFLQNAGGRALSPYGWHVNHVTSRAQVGGGGAKGPVGGEGGSGLTKRAPPKQKALEN